jgi:hypothetical protein
VGEGLALEEEEGRHHLEVLGCYSKVEEMLGLEEEVDPRLV